MERVEDGRLRTTVYRKQTASDRYLDYKSSHCYQVKWGVVSCLRKRAERICSHQEDLKKEKALLQRSFVENGYPGGLIAKRLYEEKRKRREVEEERQPILRIPYVSGIQEKVEAVARRLKIKVRYAKGRNLATILSKPKLDRIEELDQGGVVYKQECGDCDKVYIGETGRRARERKREHEKDVKEMSMKSAISEHCHTFNHRPDFSTFTVIDHEKNWRRRRIKEGLHIMTNRTFNRDSGFVIDKSWEGVLK